MNRFSGLQKTILLLVASFLAIAATKILVSSAETAGTNDCQLPGAPKYTGYSLKLGTGCRKYIQCSNGGVAATRICPEGTVYTGDVGKGGICNWASMVTCADQDGVHPTFLSSYEESAEGVQTSSTRSTNKSDSNAKKLASNLRVAIIMGENFNHTADCSRADGGVCYTQTLTLEYTGDECYSDNQFKIYFSSIHRVLRVDNSGFEHEHVIGDLTYIQPTRFFDGFESNTRTEIPLVVEHWSVQETDNMPRWFVVDERDGSTAVIENTDTEEIHNFVQPYDTTIRKTPNDNNIPMIAANRFDVNRETAPEVDLSSRIIPTPYLMNVADEAEIFDISGIYLENWELLDKFGIGATDLISNLALSGGTSPYKVSFVLGNLPNEIAGAESYVLEIKTQGATVTGTDARGLFHGLMSFIGLLDISNTNKMTLKEMSVHDKPRFTYRGHHVDVARHFRSKEAIIKTIDAMALWKLNVMHLSVTNDEGWRLEIPGLEELTSVGSRRGFDPTETSCLLTQLGSGPDVAKERQYYTRQEYIDILKYAQERNVQVLPEFNMPAHARAAVISMEARAKNGNDSSYRLTDPDDETHILTTQFYDRTSIINPCLDSSVNFVEKVVFEVKQMHDDAGVPLDRYHFGGDEAKNILLGAGFSNVSDDLKQKPFEKSRPCQAKSESDPTFDINKIANYWAIKVNKILADNGIDGMVAWEDGLRGTTKDQYSTMSVALNFWETLFRGGIDKLADIAVDGFDIVMSSPDYLYFDFPYEVNPEERGYYWAARFNSVYKIFTFAPENLAQNAETSTDLEGKAMSITTPHIDMPKILGMQGQTWSETIRTDEQYYEMVFPRMLAVSERAWHRASWELEWAQGVTYDDTTNNVPKDELAMDYHGFVMKLGCHEVLKLEKLGINYRVPPPGGKVESGVLIANSELPCTLIMYSVDDGDSWSKYIGPVRVGVGAGRKVYLQSVSFHGTLKSRVVVAEGIVNVITEPDMENQS